MSLGKVGKVASIVAAGLPFIDGKVCDSDAPDNKVPCVPLKGGTSMPVVAMGTWEGSYGDCKTGDWKCAKEHARWAVEEWLHIGGSHIDGANDYKTQTSIADALQESGAQRENVYITTKCPGAIGYEATIQCADDAMQMLNQFGTNGAAYIDLLLLHFPVIIKPECRFNKLAKACQNGGSAIPATAEQIQDTWRAYEDLKKFGVVKAIGISDFSVAQMQQLMKTAKEPVELHQVEWNPKNHDEDMLKFCKDNKIQLQAWSPLGGAKGSVLSDPSVQKIAKAHNVSTAQVTLKWALQRDVAVVVGTANADHERSDMDLFGFTLTDDEVSTINALGESSESVQV